MPIQKPPASSLDERVNPSEPDSIAVPTIDVLIVTYNNEYTLASLAQSLYRQKQVNLRIYCVDNSPGNGTFQLIKKLFPTAWAYHDCCNAGFGAGINRASAPGTGQWLLIINPDAYCEHDTDVYTLWQEAIRLQEITHTNQILIGPQLRYPDGTAYPTGRAFPSLFSGSIHAISSLLFNRGSQKYLYPKNPSLTESIVKVDWISGAAMLLPRQVFQSLGGFDRRYRMYAEDMDLCWRLAQGGGQIARTNNLEFIHIAGASSCGGNIKTISWHHISMIKFLLRTTTKINRLALPIVIPGLIVRWAALILKKTYHTGRTKKSKSTLNAQTISHNTEKDAH